MDPTTFNTCLTKICEGNYDALQNLNQYFTYQAGKGIAEVDKRCQEAFAHFLAAHNQSNPYASHYLTICYIYGYGTAPDKQKAVEINQLALSRLKHPWNLWRQAEFLHDGVIGKLVTEPKKAAALYEESAKLGFPHAEYDFGSLLLEGKVVKKDEKAALTFMESAARKGSWYACVELGNRYLYKKGLKEDVSKGLQLIKQAKDSGSINANYQYGYYLKAFGKNPDKLEIQNSLEKAAKYYHTLALHQVCYSGSEFRTFGHWLLSPFEYYFPKTNPIYFRYDWRANTTKQVYATTYDVNSYDQKVSYTLVVDYVGPGTDGPKQVARKDIPPTTINHNKSAKDADDWRRHYAKEMAALIKEADDRIQRELQAPVQQPTLNQLPTQPANAANASPNITINANGTATLTITVTLAELPALIEKFKTVN